MVYSFLEMGFCLQQGLRGLFFPDMGFDSLYEGEEVGFILTD
jgi:hypothetical protein